MIEQNPLLENSLEEFILQRPYLKDQYTYIYQMIREETCTRAGAEVLEVGSGSNLAKVFLPGVMTSDVRQLGLDFCLKAEDLPVRFGADRWDHIVGVDVLHHMDDPLLFIRNSFRVLKRGGKLVLVEPWITLSSYLVYRMFHQEECHFDVDIAAGRTKHVAGSMNGNQTVPYLVVRDHLTALREGGIHLGRLTPFASWSFPISGGIHHTPLLPYPLWKKIFAWEKLLPEKLKKFTSFRALLVFQKETEEMKTP